MKDKIINHCEEPLSPLSIRLGGDEAIYKRQDRHAPTRLKRKGTALAMGNL